MERAGPSLYWSNGCSSSPCFRHNLWLHAPRISVCFLPTEQPTVLQLVLSLSCFVGSPTYPYFLRTDSYQPAEPWRYLASSVPFLFPFCPFRNTHDLLHTLTCCCLGWEGWAWSLITWPGDTEGLDNPFRWSYETKVLFSLPPSDEGSEMDSTILCAWGEKRLHL